MTSSQAERSRLSRQRAKQLEAVRDELDHLRSLVRQPFVSARIPKNDVIEWLDDLWATAGGLEE